MAELPSDLAGFAEGWIAAWNSHDLDRVLALFDDEAVFTSPLALRVCPESHGVVRGKQALRDYWSRALNERPALAFTLTGLFAGIDSLVIGFRGEDGVERAEILQFRDGKVIAGQGTYPVQAQARP